MSSRVITFVYGDDLPELKVAEEHAKIIPDDITHEVLTQTWFRILHLIRFLFTNKIFSFI